MFAEKFRQPPHNIVVRYLDRRVVRKDDNTEALVYSTDFTNTYPITTPALCILEEKILLLAAVY